MRVALVSKTRLAAKQSEPHHARRVVKAPKRTAAGGGGGPERLGGEDTRLFRGTDAPDHTPAARAHGRLEDQR